MRTACLTVFALLSSVTSAAAQTKLEPFLPTGHPIVVDNVILSANGKFLATTGMADDTAILWDVASGRKLQTFGGDNSTRDGVKISVALSADGSTLLTGSYEKTAIVWDSVTGKKLQTFQGHAERIISVALSSDGKLAVTGSVNGEAILWQATTGKKIRSFLNFKSAITKVSLSADGRQVITVGMGGEVILWEVASGKKRLTLPRAGIPPSVALSADGKYFAVGSDDEASIWDGQTGEKSQTVMRHPRVFRVDLSPDGKLLATVSWDKTVVVWEAASGKKLGTFGFPPGGILALALSADAKLLVAPDSQAFLLDVDSGKKLRSYQFTGAKAVAVSLGGKRLAMGDCNGATLWDLTSGKRTHALESVGYGRVALSADGGRVITGRLNAPAVLWDAATGQKLQTFQEDGMGRPHPDVAITGDGKQVVTGIIGDGKEAVTPSTNGNAVLWDAATGKKLQTYKHAGPLHRIAVSSDGTKIATSVKDAFFLWEASNGNNLQLSQGQPNRWVHSVALSADGKYLVSSDHPMMADLWETATGKKLQSFQCPSAGVTYVAMSADGNRVLTGSYLMAILWDAASGRQLQTFQVQTEITSVALSGDGKQVWSVSTDGAARLWDAATGKESCALFSLDAGKDWLVVSPDGFFDGSPDAWLHVSYREAGTSRVIDDEATKKLFHRPGLLAKIIKGEKL